MYCKNCGKKLPDDARFCDRCNKSVRKKDNKQELIENLKEERLARQKMKTAQERLKKIKRVKRKRVQLIVWTVIIFAALGIISFAVTNIWFSRHSDLSDEVEATVVPDAVETAAVVSEADGQAPAVNSDGYIVTKLGSINFAYPSSFSVSYSGEGTDISLTDSTGDALIIAGTQEAAYDTTTAMKACINESGISVTEATTGDDVYSVTGTNGDNICHRLGCIKDGTETYYEFIYPVESVYMTKYEEYTAYMDAYIKKQP